MSPSRPNLFTLFLRSLSVPLAVFAVWSVADRLVGSDRWIALAAVAAFFLFLLLLTLALYAVRATLRRFRRRPEVEFGVEPPVCAACGYDLRASPDHCPECGHPVDPLDRTIIRYLTRLRRKP